MIKESSYDLCIICFRTKLKQLCYLPPFGLCTKQSQYNGVHSDEPWCQWLVKNSDKMAPQFPELKTMTNKILASQEKLQSCFLLNSDINLFLLLMAPQFPEISCSVSKGGKNLFLSSLLLIENIVWAWFCINLFIFFL